MFRRGRQQQPGFALLLLVSQLYQVGFDRIPPVTLVAILSQVAIFLRLIPLRTGWPTVADICISTHRVVDKHDFRRLVMAPFFHLDDWHLYYNMVSFLWKGMHLERRMGSPYFAYILAVFSVLTSVVTVALGMAASEFSGDQSYMSQCAAGFSGVIFALKVLTTHDAPQTQLVMGFLPVPGPFICWAELFIIQLITPNVSFIGHLAGIIVGLLYVKGPLKFIMDSVFQSAPSYTYTSGTTSTAGHGVGSRHGYGTSSGSSRGTFAWPFSGGSQRGYSTVRSRARRERQRDFPWPFNSGDEGRYPHERSYAYQSGTAGSGADGSPSGPGYNSPSESTRSAPSGPSHGGHYAYTGGLNEEEQLQHALEESQRTNYYAGRPVASAPQFPPNTPPPSYDEVTGHQNHIYPNLPTEEDTAADMRRRRLARFT